MQRPDNITAVDAETRTHVLIAEDDAELRHLLKTRLEEDGYHVVAVSDGTALRRRLEDAPPREADVDVVITDIRMPGCDGLQVLGLLRERDWALPVILMSAFADRDVCEEARRLGAAAILDKPFDVARLQSTLRTIAPAVV